MGHRNREGFNEYLQPLMLSGLIMKVGEALITNMIELIRSWIRDVTPGTIHLRDLDGTVFEGRGVTPRAERVE